MLDVTTTAVAGIGVHRVRVMKIRVRNPNPNRFDTMTHHLKAVLFDVRRLFLSDSGARTALFNRLGVSSCKALY